MSPKRGTETREDDESLMPSSSGTVKKKRAPTIPIVRRLPDDLWRKIDDLNKEAESMAPDTSLQERWEQIEKLYAANKEAHAINPQFTHRNSVEEDRDIMTLLQKNISSQKFSFERAAVDIVRRTVKTEDKDKPQLDPFSEPPIKYKGRSLHAFTMEDLESLSEDDAHEIVDLLRLTLRLLVVGFETLDMDMVFNVSSGLLAVIEYIKDHQTEFLLTVKEAGYLLFAMQRFKMWRSKAQTVIKARCQ